MPATSTLRRLLLLIALAAAGAIVASRWRTRTTPVPVEPPSWPPIRIREPVDEAGEPTETWAAPLPGGACPPGHPIKAKESSGIYHVPGGRFYDRTNADRCYADPQAAEADGYRRSKT